MFAILASDNSLHTFTFEAQFIFVLQGIWLKLNDEFKRFRVCYVITPFHKSTASCSVVHSLSGRWRQPEQIALHPPKFPEPTYQRSTRFDPHFGQSLSLCFFGRVPHKTSLVLICSIVPSGFPYHPIRTADQIHHQPYQEQKLLPAPDDSSAACP